MQVIGYELVKGRRAEDPFDGVLAGSSTIFSIEKCMQSQSNIVSQKKRR